jgi:hypothetical protein
MKAIFKSLLLVIILSFNIKVSGQWMKLNETFNGGAPATIKTIGNKLFVCVNNYPNPTKIYESSDSGQCWLLIDTIHGHNHIFGRFASIGNMIFISGGDSGVYKYIDKDKTCKLVYYIAENSYNPITTKDSIIIVGANGNGGKLCRSLDSGKTWNITDNGSLSNWVGCLTSNNSTIYVGTAGGVLISDDDGSHWYASNNSDFIQPDIGHLITKGSFVFASGSAWIYRSSDNGIHWSNITPNLGINENSEKNCFVASNSKLLLGTQNGTYVTLDDGQNWIRANSGLGKNVVNAFDTLGNYIFAATNKGVYRIDTSQIALLPCDFVDVEALVTIFPTCSTCPDGTATAYALSGIPPFTYTWQTNPIQTAQTAIGLSRGNYYSFSIKDFTGCIGNGSVYIDDFSGIDQISEDLLFQVFPNPVSDHLTMELTSNAFRSKINIFSTLGDLEYSCELSGKHIIIDVSNFRFGMHIIQVETEKGIQRRKFIKQ